MNKLYFYYNKILKNLLNAFFKIIIFYILLSFNIFKKRNFLISKNIIEISNKINETFYEKDLNFTKYSTKIKVIAIYFPQFVYINDDYLLNDKDINEWKIIIQKRSLFKDHYRHRKPDDNYINFEQKNFTKTEFIKKQIILAKNHGIYGFGINFYWFSGQKLYDEPLNIILENDDINFPFFLIWKNEKYELFYREIKVFFSMIS